MTSEFGKNRYNRYGQPSLDLVFTGSKKSLKSRVGNQQVELTRGSVGTYIDENGIIQTSNVNDPRFDHDPVTGESLGLLIEEERTNYVSNGNVTFTFGSNETIVTPNAFTAPDGSNTATRVQASNSYVSISQGTNSVPAGSTLTFSFYIYSAVEIPNFKSRILYGSEILDTVKTIPAGKWTRFVSDAIVDDTGADTTFSCRPLTTINTFGVSSTDCYIWGFQVETGSFPTSYIPTTSSTVTRAADIATIEGTNFSSWYNQSEGTVFVDRTFNINNGQTYYFTDSTLTANRIRLEGINHYGNNSSDGSFFGGSVVGNKTALGLQTDNVSVNGGTPDTSFTMPSSLDRLFIGRHPTVSSYLNGHIARLTYWPTRLPDSDLQELTQ